ncbi:MAG TPA: hypothetical protein VK025_08155 [Steroidobacter sp.]|nr:hypothetical protein [Steroidobacter sp.]
MEIDEQKLTERERRYLEHVRWIALLQVLGPLDAQQRHQQQRQQRRAQPVERWTDTAIELVRDAEQPALNERRQSEQHADAGRTDRANARATSACCANPASTKNTIA